MNKHPLNLLLVLGFGLAGSLLIGGCVATPDSAPATLSDFVEIPHPGFKQEWMVDLDLTHDYITEVYVREEFVFAYTDQHYVYVINRDDGTLKFSVQVGSRDDTLLPPVVLRDMVVIPTPATMYVFNKEGRSLPPVHVLYSMHGSVVGYGSRIFYGGDASDGGRVISIDLAKDTGSHLDAFKYWRSQAVSATPATFQDLLYSACEDGTVSAVNSEGFSIWSISRPSGDFTTYGPNKADVKADEFGVYVASADTDLYCLDRLTGKIRWKYLAGAPLSASPSVSPTMVYEIVPGLGMVAIDKISGDYIRKIKWSNPDAVQFLADDSHYSYLRRRDDTIIAVDKATGEVKFHSERSDFVAFGENTFPADKGGGIIFAATRNGHIYAIKPILTAGVVGKVVLAPQPLPPLAAAW